MVAQGTTLAGRYRLDARLGAGGMGEVWRGEDTVLARTVAVKVLLPGRLNEPGFAVRFQNEARAMATINHPGVVDVYDYGVTEVPGDGPTAFLVMRFVDGEPLDRLLTRLGRIGPEPTMDLIAQAASALQAVHDSGIVHRDVKPGNLLVRSDGTLVLTDFGIARAEGGTRLTDAGMVLGTAAYCAPEQAEGYPATPAVDIYALGVVAYECLAGQRPFDGDSPVAIALKHIRDQPPPLPPDVPGPVRAVVERAMAKDPAHRWPTAEAMSQAARQAIEAISGSSGDAYRPGQAVRPAAESHPGHGPDERLGTREGWQAGRDEDASTVVSPRHDTRPARRGRRPRKRGVAGPIVAGIAGCAVVVGLAAAGMKTLASAGSAALEPSTPQVTWATSSPVATPSRTIRRRTATPTPRPTITRVRPTSPRPSPSPSPSPSRSPSPSPSPSKNLVTVPKLIGLSERSAKVRLTQLGLLPKVAYTGTGACFGTVTVQKPAAGSKLPEGSTVTITVPKEACASPSPSPSPSGSPVVPPSPPASP